MATEQEQEKYKVEGCKAGDFAPPDKTQLLILQKLEGSEYCLQLRKAEELGGGPIENIVRGLYLTSLGLAGSLAVEIAIVCLVSTAAASTHGLANSLRQRKSPRMVNSPSSLRFSTPTAE
jgi:hypothetical protein